MERIKISFVGLLLGSLFLSCEPQPVTPKNTIPFYFKGFINSDPFAIETTRPLAEFPITTHPNGDPAVFIYSTTLRSFEKGVDDAVNIRLDCNKILTLNEIKALEGTTITSFFGFTNQYPQFFISRYTNVTSDDSMDSPDQNNSAVTINKVYRTEDFDTAGLNWNYFGKDSQLPTQVLDEIYVAECTGNFKMDDELYRNVAFNMILFTVKPK
jgi:hypothetical protein